jgi:hypothetical protein
MIDRDPIAATPASFRSLRSITLDRLAVFGRE